SGAAARGGSRRSTALRRRRGAIGTPAAHTAAVRPHTLDEEGWSAPVPGATRGRARRDRADRLVIRGAREHNLKNVSLDLPRDAMIVFTGLSGSGKSSLAFDTVFAEGQRRYVESLSAYARQFLGQMDKPDVDFIEGLSPAV